MLRLSILLVFLLGFSSPCVSQTDNVLWSSIQLKKKLDAKWSLQIEPIIRFDQDFGGYQNSSLDISLRRRLNAAWHVQLLTRTWFVPGGPDREFIWLDIAHKMELSSLPIVISNRARYHGALNLGERLDIDFFRYLIGIAPSTDWKVKPTFAFEHWFKLEDAVQGIRNRWIPGLRYQISKTIGLTAAVRIQGVTSGEGVNGTVNLWVAALSYNL